MGRVAAHLHPPRAALLFAVPTEARHSSLETPDGHGRRPRPVESRPVAPPTPAGWQGTSTRPQRLKRGATLPSGAVQTRSWMGPGRLESKTRAGGAAPRFEVGSDRSVTITLLQNCGGLTSGPWRAEG